jgi:hypothetical protein
MSTPQITQSVHPHITVGRDMRGSGCWLVVTSDQIIECFSGERALAVLQAVARTKGLTL